MRAKHFLKLYEAQQQLFEVEMSPSNLKKLASKIEGAEAGIEFEMIVPSNGWTDDGHDYDNEGEEDFSYDRRPRDINDIIRFFDGDYNDSDDLETVKEELYEKFYEWAYAEKFDEEWSSDGKEYLYNWIKNNVADDTVAEDLGKDEDEDYTPSKEDYTELTEKSWEEENTYYDDAKEEYHAEFDIGDLDEQEFLRSIGIRDMSDVNSNVRAYIRWPYWTTPESKATGTLPAIALDFMKAMGHKTVAYGNYHGQDGGYYKWNGHGWDSIGNTKPNDCYTIETDSSIEGNDGMDLDDDELGLEIVSNAMPIDQMVSDLKKVKDWASTVGGYTNNSTGLHTNVSVPNYSRDKLDYAKLALLSGDKYVLNQFGRVTNGFCESALQIIQNKAKNKAEVERLLTKLRSNVEEIASKIIHSGKTDKYTSINTKNNYIEFRSPGGDWLDENYSKIDDTILRFVVAMDAACDPKKYRKEYLKALYKTLKPKSKTDNMSLFAQFMAGDITKKAYADDLMINRADRLIKSGVKRLSDRDVDNGDWQIDYDDGKKQYTIYIAKTDKVNNAADALSAAEKFEPKLINKNTVQYCTVQQYKIDIDPELKYYKADYNHRSTGVVAKTEEEAREIIRTMEAPYSTVPVNSVNIDIHEYPMMPVRDTRNQLIGQNEKLAFAENWLKRYKIFRVYLPRYAAVAFNAYIASKTMEEAFNIAHELNPDINVNEFFGTVYMDAPNENEVEAYKNAQEDLINQRKNQTPPVTSEIYNVTTGESVPGTEFKPENEHEKIVRLRDYISFGRHGLSPTAAREIFAIRDIEPEPALDVSSLAMYRVYSMFGYEYVIAKNEDEAKDIAAKINPAAFPPNSNPSAYDTAQDLTADAVTVRFMTRQNERLKGAEEAASIVDDWLVTNDVTGFTYVVNGESTSAAAIRQARRNLPERFPVTDSASAEQIQPHHYESF